MTPTVQPAGDVPRVALLTNAPAPYRTEFLNDLASRCHLLVVFDTEREPDREWMIDTSDFRFDWVVSRGLMVSRPLVRQRRFERRVLHVPVNTLGILERFRPDIVVSGELGVRTMWAALSCLRRSRHLIVWWEGVPNTDGSGRLRTLRRTMLLRRASRVWATGLESARSLASYGVSRERVDLGMTAIDTLWWRGAVDEQRAVGREETRRELALRGAVLLFVGRLDSRKGIPELLAAFSALDELHDVPPWSVLIVGSGPLGADVDRWAGAHPEIRVGRTGFVQPASLPRFYAAADIFVLASLEDPWGAVCMEALVAGLPQVTSSKVGSALDLVTSLDIGDIVDPHDAQSFARRLADRIREAPTLVPATVRTETAEHWSSRATAARAMASLCACLKA